MKIVRWCVGSWLSRIYLVLVAAATVDAVVSILMWDGEVPTYPDIVPTALTLPGSMIGVLFTFLPIPWGDGTFWWSWLSGVTVGALINAAILNGLVAIVRRLMAKLRSSRPAADA